MSISSEVERIIAGKADIASAIEEKGVEVPEGTKINEMATYVRNIQTGGDGGNADWNAAEGEPGHVLNRTHYIDNATMMVVPEFTGEVDEYGAAMIAAPYEYFPQEGEMCVIVYNGETYECVACYQDMSDLIPGSVAVNIGNLSLVDCGEDSGESFCVTLFNETISSAFGLYGQCAINDGSTSVTVSVQCMGSVYRKIDPRFIHSADWNATEGSAGHVLNRTHYTEEKFLVNETTLTTAEPYVMLAEMPVAGETYKVKWNGTDYECVCFQVSDYVFLGNDETSGEPFTLMFSDFGIVACSITPLDGSTTFTISIAQSVVHPLDEKFIPDMSRLILTSPNGTRYKITVDDTGTLSTTAV